MTISPALHASDRMDWNTPQEVLQALDPLGPIWLDPCSNAASIVNAATEWRIERGEDGLARPWLRLGFVFVNPEYGRALSSWAEKIATEARYGVEIVSLVPARTDTQWWATLVAGASAVLFLKGRLTFLGAPHPAPFPSALVYHGPRWARFLAAYEGLGWAVRP